MKACEALVIGGSAGSLDVLLKVLPELNPELSFPIIIVMHRKPGKDSILTDLLSAKTQLPVKEIEEKETIRPTTVYIAPPNYHVLIENNRTFSLDASEKVNFSGLLLMLFLKAQLRCIGKIWFVYCFPAPIMTVLPGCKK